MTIDTYKSPHVVKTQAMMLGDQKGTSVLLGSQDQMYYRKCTKSICDLCLIQDINLRNEIHKLGDDMCQIRKKESPNFDFLSFDEYGHARSRCTKKKYVHYLILIQILE